MFSANGTGTTLYGKADFKPDGSYIATKWFTLFYFPVFPLGSYRVIKGESKRVNLGIGSSETKYQMVKVKTDIPSIIRTYFLVYLSLILIIWATFHYEQPLIALAGIFAFFLWVIKNK